jgi:hypothetical protein
MAFLLSQNFFRPKIFSTSHLHFPLLLPDNCRVFDAVAGFVFCFSLVPEGIDA